MPAEALCGWLDRVLRGEIVLPAGMPDDAPFDTLIELEPCVSDAVRRSFDRAIAELLDGYLANSSGSAPLSGLLHVLASLKMQSLGWRLASYVSGESSAFRQLETRVRNQILSAIVDLRCRQGEQFWQDVFDADPTGHAAVVFYAMGDMNPRRAVAMLERVPDDEDVAAEIAEIHLPVLYDEAPPPERQKLVAALRSVLSQCQPAMEAELRLFFDDEGLTVEPPVPPDLEPFMPNVDAVLNRFGYPTSDQANVGIIAYAGAALPLEGIWCD